MIRPVTFGMQLSLHRFPSCEIESPRTRNSKPTNFPNIVVKDDQELPETEDFLPRRLPLLRPSYHLVSFKNSEEITEDEKEYTPS